MSFKLVVCRRIQQRLAIGEYVQADRNFPAGIEIYLSKITSCEHGRVDQDVERRRLEIGEAVMGRTRRIQRRRIAPVVGQPNAGGNFDLPTEVAGRVERNRNPLQVQHLGRHDHPALVARCRRQDLEADVQGLGVRRRINLECEDVDRVAPPGHRLPVSLDR